MSVEAQHLAEADRHIADAERRISEQERRISDMEAAGHDVAEGHRLLANLREALKELYVHRRMILDEIAREQRV
jgi:hypothetical protein